MKNEILKKMWNNGEARYLVKVSHTNGEYFQCGQERISDRSENPELHAEVEETIEELEDGGYIKETGDGVWSLKKMGIEKAKN